MKEHVTVIPSDGIIMVDGMPLSCKFTPHVENLHALQWHHGTGEREITDRGFMSNHAIASYETDVRPYVDIWQSVYDLMHSTPENDKPEEKMDWLKSILKRLS